MIAWDGKSVDIVAYKDGHRHRGNFAGNDMIRFVHSESGDDAWVSRSVCHRDM